MDLTKENVSKFVVQQIVHISRHGCSGIKCKRCSLNRVCEDRKPENSKELASKMMFYAQTYKGKIDE